MGDGLATLPATVPATVPARLPATVPAPRPDTLPEPLPDTRQTGTAPHGDTPTSPPPEAADGPGRRQASAGQLSLHDPSGIPGLGVSLADSEVPGTLALPGFIYLRRPGPDAVAPPGPSAHADEGGPSRRAPELPPVAYVARLLHAWLEAWDGFRPVHSLRRGPFAPGVVERVILEWETRARQAGQLAVHPRSATAARPAVSAPRANRGTLAPRGGQPQVGPTIVSLHLQPQGPGATRKVPFCASVRRGPRIQAVAGYLTFYGPVSSPSPAGAQPSRTQATPTQATRVQGNTARGSSPQGRTAQGGRTAPRTERYGAKPRLRGWVVTAIRLI